MYLGDKPWMEDIIYGLAAPYCPLSLRTRVSCRIIEWFGLERTL